MTETELVKKLRSSEAHQVLNDLYDYFPIIRRLISQENGTESDAQDAFQESIWVLYQNCQKPDFQLTASVKTYLSAVSLNQWRKKKRSTQKEWTTDTIPEPSNWDMEAENKTEAEAEMEWVAEKILEKLGEPCSEVLKHYYYLKLSMQQIAEKMGYSSEHSAKTQKYKCLERAKKLAQMLFKTPLLKV